MHSIFLWIKSRRKEYPIKKDLGICQGLNIVRLNFLYSTVTDFAKFRG